MDFTKLLFERNVTKDFLSKSVYNEILFESENFIVIPSLGSLVKGWLLVVPKSYALSMGHLNSELHYELEELSQNVISILEKEFGEVIAFEHGASLPNNVVGCGVDYAHLHLVPISINLIQELDFNFNVKFDWNVVSGLEFASMYSKQNMPYLYVQSSSNQRFITTSQNISSQLFRRVIAKHLSIPEEYDWKLYHKMENVKETISVLSKYPKMISRKIHNHG